MTSQPGGVGDVGESLARPKCRDPLANSSGWAACAVLCCVLSAGTGPPGNCPGDGWWVHPVHGGACSGEQGWTISDDLQSIWIVFDALVHVSECRHKSASTAAGERVTETTGASPWGKAVMGLRCSPFPPLILFGVEAGDAIARACSEIWAGRSQGVCGNPWGRGGRAEERCPVLPWHAQAGLPFSAVRGEQQWVTHLSNVGGMMHHSPCSNYFW